MKVSELITELTAISNQDADVVMVDDSDFEYNYTSANFDGVDKVELIFDGVEA